MAFLEQHEEMFEKARLADDYLAGRYEGYRRGYAPAVDGDGDLVITYGHSDAEENGDLFRLVQDVVRLCDLAFVGAEQTAWEDVDGYGTRGYVYDFKFTSLEGDRR